ncbi:MAG: T9SS type A sorting domain-containing protein [Cyclobacteriaceae bacterium]
MYSITSSFTTGNVFTAQLSNASGSFASPIDIGSASTTFAGQITVTIPTTQSAGSGYRIRVVGSTPSTIGTDNGADFIIKAIDLNAPTFVETSFCPGASFTLNYSLVNSCEFISGNIFTAQLSNSSGSFALPTILESTTANGAGSLTVTIPTSTPAGTGYRLRLVASNPSRISPDNGTNLTVNAYGINAPTFVGTSFCRGEPLTVGYTIQNGCGFPFLPSNNIFTAQLSNSSGSFASPTNIGSVVSTNSGFIQATIPIGIPAVLGYKIRVVSSNPGSGVIGIDNGTSLTVNAPVGNPTIFGSSVWNAYAYSGTALPITNNTFFGSYSENNLNFDTKNRWVAAAGPGTADASSGSAYSGCPLPGTNYSISFKRTNFTCGYYQIDIPFQDDGVTLFVNGAQVFQNNSYTPTLQSNVWTGFLGASSTVEIQFVNLSGGGQLQVAFNTAPNPLTITDPVIVCTTSSAILKVSSTLLLSYVWSPASGLSTTTGSTVTANPSSTTTYTATGADAATGCSVSKSVIVTVIPPSTVPTISLTNLPSTICTGITTSTLTASGANTYTWSPSNGLSATTGSTVIANPSITTTYTVTGTTGCQSGTNTATVTVQPAATNSPSTFGSGAWNVYCHNNTSFSNYYGYYTENNLSFNTTNRWANDSGPTVANASSGSAYSGCSFGSVNYSMSFRRTNFTCGYYQIDIPFQDDAVAILVNGVQVFQNFNFTPSLQTNVWTGFLGPATTLEIKFVNTQLFGQLEIGINPSSSVPQTLNSNSTICVGGSANLSATSLIVGATYAWSVVDASSTITFSNASIANPLLLTTSATPASTYTVTNVLTDAAGSNCSSSKTFVLTVANQSNTTVSPTSASNILTSCTNIGTTLTASGANNYSWSPSDGLSSTTGFSVVAKPLVTTTYTVTGSNSCSSKSTTTTVTVSPLPAITSFPAGGWNIYGFNSSTVGTNYQGFYTENGFGTTGLNFDTRTRWASNDVPSNANASNGIIWQGCTMNAGGTSLSLKRTGFTCGVYQLDVPSHADGFLLFINGIQVAQHNGCCDVHTNLWTGVLTSNSTVEWQLIRNGAESYLQVAFTLIAQPTGQTVWLGGTSTDWFNTTNWCGGIPTATADVLIPAAGPQNMPVINAAGAVAKNVTVNPAIPSGTFITAIPAASLTSNAFNLDVHGNWTNNGIFTPNAGTISFVGTGSSSIISSSAAETFNNLIINKANGVTLSSGTHQVSGTLTLTNGIVVQNSSLKILSGGAVANASNSGYVDGVITKIGNAAFTFPVGKGLLYRPITISAPATATDAYSAQYFNVNPNGTYSIAQRALTLDRVSSAEYWMLNRTAGTSNVNVTLSWGSNSEAVVNPSLLRVAAWDGSLWTDQGNGATTGTTAFGTVTTGVSSTVYGPFTLNENKLPVGLEEPSFSKTDVHIYPNPTASNATLELNGAAFNSISITNNLGQEINCDYSVGSTKVEINTNGLTPGLYIVNISVDQKPSKLKLMIQR